MNRYEAWSAHGETVRLMVSENRPRHEIVAATGLNPQTILNWINKHEWDYRPSHAKTNTKSIRMTADVLACFDRLLVTGQASASQVSRETGLSIVSVIKLLRLHRSEQWADLLAEKPPAATRTCTRCLRTLPASEFPERADRVGKGHSQCFRCRIDWAREYRHDNPIPIREASRRRRARIGSARTDGHREADIDTASGCWFCGMPIDLALRHPHPMALAINHIHPVAKRGPDILKNVAAAHAECNRRAKDNYVPAFRFWSVAPIPLTQARALAVERHYLHRPPNASFAYAVYDALDEIRGVITFGSPSSMRISRSASTDPSRVIELNRLWVDDSAPFGLASWFVGRAMKQLPAAIVVAYADLSQTDPRYGSAHIGGVYRACSFNYGGSSRPNVEWVVPGTTRNVGKHVEGAVQVQVSPKARYWQVTGSKTDKRALRSLVVWPALSYPKGLIKVQPSSSGDSDIPVPK